jgi:hypothetical protein
MLEQLFDFLGVNTRVIVSLCAAVIVTIGIILLVIFAPKVKTFYSLPFQDNTLQRTYALEDIRQIKDQDWKVYPDSLLPNTAKKNNFQIFELFLSGKINPEFIQRCPHLYEYIKDIPNVKSAFIARLTAKTTLIPKATWKSLANSTLRCVFAIRASDDPKIAGVWVEGTVKPLQEWVVFDHSKKWSFFNSDIDDALLLVIDVDRPIGVPIGVSEELGPTANI